MAIFSPSSNFWTQSAQNIAQEVTAYDNKERKSEQLKGDDIVGVQGNNVKPPAPIDASDREVVGSTTNQ